MAADTRVKIGSSWRQIGADGIYVHDTGSFQQVDFAYMKKNGVWETVYISDKTGPGPATNVSVAWEYPGIRIDWTNPGDSDYDRMQLAIYPRGEPWIDIVDVDSPGTTYYWNSSYIRDNQIYDIFLRPIDSNDNVGTGVWEATMEFTGAARGRTKSPIEIRPIDSGTWRGSAWRTGMPGNDQRVYQGSSISGDNIGVFFYGTQFWDLLRGATITAGRLDLQRLNSTGTGEPVAPDLYWSQDVTSKASIPGLGTWNDNFFGTSMTRYSSPPPYGSTVLPVNWRNAIGADSLASSLRSVVLYSTDTVLQGYLGDVSESYMTLYGKSDPGPYFGLYPGNIYVEHSG